MIKPMTFEEWYEKNEAALRYGIDFIAHRVLTGAELKDSKEQMKRIANDVWKAAQPKWTLCKDKLPDTEGNYLWLHADKSIHVDYYWTNLKLMSYVIAWMPLPEVPAGINSGFNKQGANI